MDTNNFDAINFLSMVGEWAIAAVIYWEFESNRLDRFLADAFSEGYSKDRSEIYEQYCGVAVPSGTTREIAFKDLFKTDDPLRIKCERQLALLNSVGSRLPKLPPFKNRAIEWFPHTAIFMWKILEPYIKDRRAQAGSHWANSFEKLALACQKELKCRGQKQIVLVDPKHRQNIAFDL